MCLGAVVFLCNWKFLEISNCTKKLARYLPGQLPNMQNPWKSQPYHIIIRVLVCKNHTFIWNNMFWCVIHQLCWSMLTISGFFSNSSASPPAVLLVNTPDFLLFLRFVRFFFGFSSSQCPWFLAFSLIRPLLLRFSFRPMPLISCFFSGSFAAFRNRKKCPIPEGVFCSLFAL